MIHHAVPLSNVSRRFYVRYDTVTHYFIIYDTITGGSISEHGMQIVAEVLLSRDTWFELVISYSLPEAWYTSRRKNIT